MTNLPTVVGVSNTSVKEESPQELYAEYNDVISFDFSTPESAAKFLRGGYKRERRRVIRCDRDERRLRPIDWDDIEMREALVKTTKLGLNREFLFMIYVVAPLYNIIYYSRNYAGIYDYVNIVKSLNIVTPLEFSSKDVYNLLNSYRKMKRDDKESQLDVDNLLCYYYPERAVYEKLKSLLDNEKESEFCEMLANLDDENIYKHCHYYKTICNMFDRVCIRADFQPLIRTNVHCIMGIIEDYDEHFFLTYEAHVMQLLLDVESIIKPKRLAADFQRLLDIPYIAELYAKAKGGCEPSDSRVDDTKNIYTTPVDVMPADPPPAIPDELNTPEAKAIFDKAIEKGYMKIENGWYIWIGLPDIGRKASLSRFAAGMCDHINSNHCANGKNKRRFWKPFEILFNTEHLAISCDQSWDTSVPYDELDNFFKELT